MADRGSVTVRINVVGHASPRWRGAHSSAEAERLNQALSERRAASVYSVVEQILKSELPGYNIQPGELGVGSHNGFPSVREDDNAAIDRTVLVTVELVTSTMQPSAPQPTVRRLYTPSKVWNVSVINFHKLGAGALVAFLRISLENPFLKDRSLSMAGYLYGGGSPAKSWKDAVKQNIPSGKPTSLSTMLKPIGHTQAFHTDEAMDFDNWVHGGPQNDGKGVWTQMGGAEAKFGIASKGHFIRFPNLGTGPVVYDSKILGLGLKGGDFYLVSGKIFAEPPVPSSYMEFQSSIDLPPTQVSRSRTDGVLLFFPTGKSNYTDLTDRDRDSLREFVIQRSRTIKDLASSNLAVVGG